MAVLYPYPCYKKCVIKELHCILYFYVENNHFGGKHSLHYIRRMAENGFAPPP